MAGSDLPHFEYLDRLASQGDPDGLIAVCIRRILLENATQLAAFAADDPEALEDIQRVFKRFRGRDAARPKPPHLIAIIQSQLARKPGSRSALFWPWLSQAVRELLFADPTLAKKAVANLLEVPREHMSKEPMAGHFRRYKKTFDHIPRSQNYS